MIKYIVVNGKVEQCSTREFSSVLRAACSVLRASVNQTKGIHSFNFSSVLRAACKYELALFTLYRKITEIGIRKLTLVFLFLAILITSNLKSY